MEASEKNNSKIGPILPHVGNFINYYLVSQKISKAQLARDLMIRPTSLNDYFKNESLQVATLWKLSVALKHNFIAQLAEYLYLPYATKREVELQKQIETLQKTVQTLELQIEVYKNIVKST